MSKIETKQVCSANGEWERHRKTVRALGLRSLRDLVVHDDTPQIRGMIEMFSIW